MKRLCYHKRLQCRGWQFDPFSIWHALYTACAKQWIVRKLAWQETCPLFFACIDETARNKCCVIVTVSLGWNFEISHTSGLRWKTVPIITLYLYLPCCLLLLFFFFLFNFVVGGVGWPLRALRSALRSLSTTWTGWLKHYLYDSSQRIVETTQR